MAERRQHDEETPLLRPQDDSNDPKKSVESPIPWAQFSIVLFLQLAEPLTSQVIYPFVPQLIREIGVTGGDDTKVGYYVGLMQSIFFATQAMTVLHWSRISDRVGRKPVILVGLFGLSLSMYCFGLSRTFWGLVVSRSLAGALNGNIGVIKSMIGELTDSTNVARAFAYQPIAWSSGATIGPLIGGALSHPAERFPSLFGESTFFKRYPYFLPCSIPAMFSIVAWIVSYMYLKETNPTGFKFSRLFRRSEEKDSEYKANDLPNKPVGLSTLLTPRVLISAGNYALLSLVDIAYRALQPLFYSTPLRLGGLGLPPHTIGLCLAFLGLGNGLFQVLFFADIHKRVGTKRLYQWGIYSSLPIFLLFPIMSLIARNWGVGSAVYTAIAVQLALTIILNTCYGCIFIFITAAAPSKRTLGSTNGLAQMTVSIMRCIGPSIANSLFSLSLSLEFDQGKGLVAGWIVYYAMFGLVAIASAGSALLPGEMWKRESEE